MNGNSHEGGNDETEGNDDDATPAVPSVDMQEISDETRRQFELVPDIGTRWRWYDPPYRLLNWLVSGWRRRVLPWRVRHRLTAGINFLSAFNSYDRAKVERRDRPHDNIIVPPEEDIAQGGIWVIEFFPPSYFEQLMKSLKANGWDRNEAFRALDGSNAEQVVRARRGQGFAWTRLGAVARPDAGFLAIGTKRETLPEEFALIDLTVMQLGTSLTAVVAFVRLSEMGGSALNRVWKDDHEPLLQWQGFQRPNVENRYFSTIIATQRERERLHDLARDWLARRCGGFFADTDRRQPVIDFSTFTHFDPTTESADGQMHDPLRALGMQGRYPWWNFVSPQLPGLVMVEGEALSRPDRPLRNCWGIVGNRQVVEDQTSDLGYGPKPYSARTLAGTRDEAVRLFLLHVGVEQYARRLLEFAAEARDTARQEHREFSPRRLDALKQNLLTTSLDLPAVSRDTAELWTERQRHWAGIEVSAVAAPGALDPPEGFDLIEQIGKSRDRLFQELMEDDDRYRGVLATTSALGASAASTRLGRRALLVSLTSLLVSAATLVAVHGSTIWCRLQELLPFLR